MNMHGFCSVLHGFESDFQFAAAAVFGGPSRPLHEQGEAIVQ